MLRTILNAFSVADIRKKLAFTAAMLALYRLGAYIPALRSYTPVATNQPSASANTIGDQENRETRAGSFMRWHLDRQPEGAYR